MNAATESVTPQRRQRLVLVTSVTVTDQKALELTTRWLNRVSLPLCFSRVERIWGTGTHYTVLSHINDPANSAIDSKVEG